MCVCVSACVWVCEWVSVCVCVHACLCVCALVRVCEREINTQKSQAAMKCNLGLKQWLCKRDTARVESPTDHDGNVMSVVERQWSVLSQQVVLCLDKGFQVLGVVAHHLVQVLQPVVLQKWLDEHHLFLQQSQGLVLTPWLALCLLSLSLSLIIIVSHTRNVL